ncbi:hypothetical protein SNEBB_010911 [Seison nebaliae]|nr:hypothetical protein SNEBB_010911 [Seison nebaliae]
MQIARHEMIYPSSPYFMTLSPPFVHRRTASYALPSKLFNNFPSSYQHSTHFLTNASDSNYNKFQPFGSYNSSHRNFTRYNNTNNNIPKDNFRHSPIHDDVQEQTYDLSQLHYQHQHHHQQQQQQQQPQRFNTTMLPQLNLQSQLSSDESSPSIETVVEQFDKYAKITKKNNIDIYEKLSRSHGDNEQNLLSSTSSTISTSSLSPSPSLSSSSSSSISTDSQSSDDDLRKHQISDCDELVRSKRIINENLTKTRRLFKKSIDPFDQSNMKMNDKLKSILKESSDDSNEETKKIVQIFGTTTNFFFKKLIKHFPLHCHLSHNRTTGLAGCLNGSG